MQNVSFSVFLKLKIDLGKVTEEYANACSSYYYGWTGKLDSKLMEISMFTCTEVCDQLSMMASVVRMISAVEMVWESNTFTAAWFPWCF